MRTSNFTALILLFFISLFNNPLSASHVIGGYITYKCLGNNVYEIELKRQEYCTLNTPNVQVVNVYSANCGFNTSLQLTLSNSIEVSSLCLLELPNSSCNSGVYDGEKLYTFTGQITLAPCSDWVISNSTCCRTNAITNAVNPGIYDVYLETTLNSLAAPCNNGVEFMLNKSLFLYAGELNNLNFGAWDPDGDSIAISLVNPLGSPSNPVPFNIPYSANYPIATAPSNSFGLNEEIGQLTFTPSVAQLAMMAIKAEEYRNGSLIGSTIYDRAVYVLGVNSDPMHAYQPPLPGSVSGGTINGQVLETTAGQTLSFSFQFTDPDTSTLSLVSNISTTIPGATLTTSGTNPLQVDFDWPTTSANIGFNYFAVSVMDQYCPYNKYLDMGFLIKVRTGCNLNADFQYTAQVDSAGTQVNFTDNSTPTGSYSSGWDFGDGATSVLMHPTHYYSDTASLDSIKSYQVCLTLTDTLACTTTYCDSISVFVNPFGAISGGIYEGVNFAGPGDPIPNVTIHLEDPSGNILQTDISDINGLYRFSPIWLRSYVLRIDQPGVIHSGHPVTLTHSKPYYTDLDFDIDSDGGVMTIIEDLNRVEELTIIPNPIADVAKVLLQSSKSIDATLSLFTVAGEQVQALEVQLVKGQQTLMLKTDQLQSGIYFISLKTENGITVKRLVKL